jgi:phosphatidylserine decarboxylase
MLESSLFASWHVDVILQHAINSAFSVAFGCVTSSIDDLRSAL